MTDLLMGAVAYDPKVVTIWEGFRDWLRPRNLDFDFLLYSHYERQVEDLVAGHLDAAWNSPLAWIRTQRLAERHGVEVEPLVMRDTDRDLTAVIIARTDSAVASVADLKGRTVATGAVDSPQATLLPLAALRQAGLEPGDDLSVRRFDVGVGLHGDHVGGERDAARALVRGEVDAACVLDANRLLFSREGTLPGGQTRVLLQTDPFDHCNLTVTERVGREVTEHFARLLRSMSYEDPEVRPLLDLEGLTSWEQGRTSGYAALTAAVDRFGFYDQTGEVTADDYRP